MTERTLVFLGGGNVWLEVGIWVLGALIVALTFKNHRRLEPAIRRYLMVGLRAFLVLLLILFFYQPAFLEERVAINKNTLILLTDLSGSMALPHGDKVRGELLSEWTARNASDFEEVAEKRNVHVLGFSEFLGEDMDPKKHGGATKVLDTLRELRDRFRNQDLGGIVLLSDGIDSTSEGRRSTLSPELEAIVRELGAPVSAITMSGDSELKDIAVSHVGASSFTLLLNQATIDATVQVHGYPEGQLAVRLFENGTELATELVATRPAETHYKVKFQFVPKKLGKHVYTVAVDALPDEIYAKNNRRSVIVNVVRDKIRVVQVVGQPSWDQRHMRNLLKENPNVDLVSFFILVNRFGPRPVGPRETSLIPFPVDELFGQELGGFDLLVMQNFNYGPYQMRQYLPHIAKFVRDGGALVMVGGPLSMSAGGYYGTELAEVLPVDLPATFGEGSGIDTNTFQPRLTESGGFHPITRLALDPAQNTKVWSDIHPLEGLNMSARPKPGAVVLVEHPELKDNDGKPQPVVSVHEVGEGRAMVVATDSTWFWNFKAGNRGEDSHHYTAFWENAIRWLIRDPELDLLKVRALRQSVPVGEQSELIVTAFQADYRPAARQRVEITLRKRNVGDGPGEGEVISRQTELVTDAQGELRVSLPVAADGIYEVEAVANIVAGRQTRASDLYVGVDTNPELEQVIPDDRLVTNLAKATGGKVLPLTAGWKDIPLEEPTVMRVKSRTHQELWSAPWALMLAALFFGLEWWLRRRYGYL